MTFRVKVGDEYVTVETGCKNPELEGNSCPIHGDCNKCRFGVAEMTIQDFLKIRDALK